MTDHTVILRGWPGTKHWSPPGPLTVADALSSQVSMIVHFARDSAEEADTFGLGAVLVVRGGLVLHGLLLVADTLGTVALGSLRAWGEAHRASTVLGLVPWRVVTVGQFFTPTVSDGEAPWAFSPRAYSGKSPVIGADLGRSLGLVSDHVVERQGKSAGSFEVWLPGWGKDRGAKGIGRVSPHRPALRVRSRRAGWSIEFGPVKQGHGKHAERGPWRGCFVDLLSMAYALDADRPAGYVDHARHFSSEADELPVEVTVDTAGARTVTDAVAGLHRLFLAVDTEAGRWFTSPQDRRRGAWQLDLSHLQSPAALADQFLRRCRLTPPLQQFGLSDQVLACWQEGFHGGWCDYAPALWSRGFGAVIVDMTSAYPLVAHLVSWWETMTATDVAHETVAPQLRALCEEAARDPSVVLDPGVWSGFGLTLAEVAPNGERFPVSVDDPHRPDGRTETVALFAHGRTMYYGWPDVVAAAVLSGCAPKIIRAIRLAPVGHQASLPQRVPVLPGLVIETNRDPALALVARRRQEKDGGNTVLARELHTVVNALVSGNPSRFDDIFVRHGRTWRRQERPGPWCFPPIAVTVTAGARLLLAVVARRVDDLGGIVAYRDTDSSIIPASPIGGIFDLKNDRAIRELSDADIDTVLEGFDALSPDPAWAVWKRKPEPEGLPMRSIIFGPKRHAEYQGTDIDPVLASWTEATLGGRWADPTGMAGPCPEGGQTWSKAAVAREVRFAAARNANPDRAAREPSPWDDANSQAFPTLRRLQVTTPDLLHTLPASLGAHMGTRYLEGVVDTTRFVTATKSVVALDPGGDLISWQGIKWLDRASGAPVWVSTDPMDTSAVLLESLSARAARYGAPPRGEPIDAVTVTPWSLRFAGRVSTVIDADTDGVPGSLSANRIRYEDACGLAPSQCQGLIVLARSLSYAEFARRTGSTARTARAIASGRLPGPKYAQGIVAALRREGITAVEPRCCACGCGEVLDSPHARYASPSHRERAKKRRARGRVPPTTPVD